MSSQKPTQFLLDQSTIDFLKDTIRTHIPDVSFKAFVFGSWATQTNQKYSDIELGIMGPRPLSSKEFVSVDNDLEESSLLYNVSLVDFAKVSAKFKKESLGSVINLV